MIFISLHIYSVLSYLTGTPTHASYRCKDQWGVLPKTLTKPKALIIRTSKYFNKICNCSIQLYRLMWRSDYIVGFLSLNHSFQQNIWLQSDIIFTCT